MPLRKHNPVNHEQMLWASPNFSICQVLREIYHSTEDEEIRYKCRLAVSMAKSMTARLELYKKDWHEGYWDKNDHFDVELKKMEKMSEELPS